MNGLRGSSLVTFCVASEELERNQVAIAELSEKLAQLAEHNFELETELENEELKQKTCSSVTQHIFDTLVAGELN